MKRYVLMLSILVFGISTWAQSPPHQHQAPKVSVVEGSVNPELIPDSTMYRLFLLNISTSATPTDQEREKQSAHLTAMGLKGTDRIQAMMVLSDFKTQYRNLVARYNEYATEMLKEGTQPDDRLFLQQRDDLVQITRDSLGRVLSVSGRASFDGYVQNEKKHVQIHTLKGDQQ